MITGQGLQEIVIRPQYQLEADRWPLLPWHCVECGQPQLITTTFQLNAKLTVHCIWTAAPTRETASDLLKNSIPLSDTPELTSPPRVVRCCYHFKGPATSVILLPVPWSEDSLRQLFFVLGTGLEKTSTIPSLQGLGNLKSGQNLANLT